MSYLSSGRMDVIDGDRVTADVPGSRVRVN